MVKKRLFLFSLLCVMVFAGSCASGDPLKVTNTPAVIFTRVDDNGGVVEIYVDGKKVGKLNQGGKWGYVLQNGRHTVSVVYNKNRSDVIDFMISNNRRNFRVTAFLSDRPGLIAF